jgi:hypothetical protein
MLKEVDCSFVLTSSLPLKKKFYLPATACLLLIDFSGWLNESICVDGDGDMLTCGPLK